MRTMIRDEFPGYLRLAASAAALLCVAVLVVLSLLPSDEMVRTGAPKVFEHFVAYAGTGMFAGIACARSSSRTAAALFALIVLAAVLEYSQRWAPGRDPGFDTFIASSVGACAGVLVTAWICNRFPFAGWPGQPA